MTAKEGKVKTRDLHPDCCSLLWLSLPSWLSAQGLSRHTAAPWKFCSHFQVSFHFFTLLSMPQESKKGTVSGTKLGETLRCPLLTLQQRERKMLQISKDASPHVAVVLGAQKGGGEKRWGRWGHILILSILLLCYICTCLQRDLYISPIVYVCGCDTPQDKRGRNTLLAISYAVCHLAGSIYHRESRDHLVSQQSCFSVYSSEILWRWKEKGKAALAFLILTSSKNTWQMEDYVENKPSGFPRSCCGTEAEQCPERKY